MEKRRKAKTPLALGASCAPSASALAEPQGCSNFPQLPSHEFKIGTTTGLTSEPPLSNRETGEGPIPGSPVTCPARAGCQGRKCLCFPDKVKAARWVE